MAYHGKFYPKNPAKYKGNISNIEYRSLWEKGFMKYCDDNPSIVRWNSEEVIIPYRSTADQGKLRRYFVDFWVKYQTGDEIIIEIKPFKETQPPAKPARLTEQAKRRIVQELYTWQVNQDKWKAAMDAAQQKGWRFVVLTEKTLPRFGIKC